MKYSVNSRVVWNILGLPFDVLNLESSVEQIQASMLESQLCFFSTPNLNFVIATQTDTDFFQSVVDSDLSVADGMPLIWVAKLLGIPLVERVAGSDIFKMLSENDASENKASVFFFGGEKGVAKAASIELEKKSRGMKSCGYYDPGFVPIDEMSSQQIINYINKANPDFLVVALGAKKGQSWIQLNRKKLNVPVISHLGAVVNFVAGTVERAPVLWQRMGLEWLWRIRQEPVLWKRYLFDGLSFAKLLLVSVFPLAVYNRILRNSECFDKPCCIDSSMSPDLVVYLSGSIHAQTLNSVKKFLSPILDNSIADLRLNFSAVSYIDGAFIGTLMIMQSFLNKQDHKLVLEHVPKRINRILKMNNVLGRFQIEN